MFFEKELFCARWYKSVKKSKTVSCIGGCFCNPEPTNAASISGLLSFEKPNVYYNKIISWLDDHEMEYHIYDGDSHNDLILKIIFNF